MDKFVLHIPDSILFTDEQLLALCECNSHLRIEMDSEQNLSIMSPTGLSTGHYNSLLNFFFLSWNRTHKLGYIFDSSTGFRLPDGSIKSPDVSFVSNEKFNLLSDDEKRGFAPICPDFVLELRSATDTKKTLLSKIEMYMQNGCSMAWLIDPLDMEVVIYKVGSPIEQINIKANTVLEGMEVLSGFSLELSEVFE